MSDPCKHCLRCKDGACDICACCSRCQKCGQQAAPTINPWPEPFPFVPWIEPYEPYVPPQPYTYPEWVYRTTTTNRIDHLAWNAGTIDNGCAGAIPAGCTWVGETVPNFVGGITAFTGN